MTKPRSAKAVDPLAAVTPAYVNMFSRFRTVIERVRANVTTPMEWLDLNDVEELEHVYETMIQIERQMRRWMKEANTKGG